MQSNSYVLLTFTSNLANVAEQVHRSRVLADERNNGGSWLSRAVDHILEAKNSGHDFSDDQLRKWLEDFQVRPVFTAHPTEAARRSVLSQTFHYFRVTRSNRITRPRQKIGRGS